MAFSYSDKNFTVIGNLCFVHIILDGTQTSFDIPPDICDRMLFYKIDCIYLYRSNEARIITNPDPNSGYANIFDGKIICSSAGQGYLYFYFPIDSNK